MKNSEYEVAKGISLGISIPKEPVKSLEAGEAIPEPFIEYWKKTPVSEKENTFEMLLRKKNIVKVKDIAAGKKAEEDRIAKEKADAIKAERDARAKEKANKKDGDIQ